MNILLYYNKSPNNYLNKELEELQSIDFNLKNQFNIQTPQIVLGSVDFSNILKANYAYISDWKRYFYIRNISHLNAKQLLLSLDCDVLMSFRESIKNSSGILKRQSNRYNMYLSDSQFATENREITNTYQFPNGFSESNYLLTVLGGV